MAITSTTRDVRYPGVGDKVTIGCVYTVGNRFRCKLTNKPIDSALETWTDAKENWLEGNQITPDVVGCYTATVVEETVANPVPHFSNDTGAGQCVEVVTPVDTDTHSITVAGKVKRQVGFAPDDVTLELNVTTDDFAPGWMSPTSGALTRYTDAPRCPRLTNPSSDIARIAMAQDVVARQVAEIGGYGNESVASGVQSYKYGDRTDQVLPIVEYDDIEDWAVLTSFAWTIARMNYHITAPSVMIHGVADAANVVTAADAVAGDEPTQRVLLNDILTILSAHVAVGGGGVHSTADTIAMAALALLAALPNPSTLQQRINRTNALFDIMDDHFVRRNLTLVPAAGVVHTTIADCHMDYDTLYPAHNDATVVASANAMKTQYNLHRVRVVVLAAPLYHAIAGGANSTFNDTMPVDSAGIITAVRKALQVLQAHVTNVEFTSGASIVYHTTADFGSRTDVIPGPSDYAGAINALEALNWTLAKHANLGLDTHGITHAGMAKKRPAGIEAIHHAFRLAATYTGTTVPASENAAYARLIVGGGFSKA